MLIQHTIFPEESPRTKLDKPRKVDLIFYVLEEYIIYFIGRCWFLNRRAVWVGWGAGAFLPYKYDITTVYGYMGLGVEGNKYSLGLKGRGVVF